MTLDHWETYYRGGALVSCPTGPELNYSREVRDAWTRFFTQLANGAKILDIGCGNGPVALIAAETAARLSRQFQIEAVDLAEIDPPAHVPNGKTMFADIRFQSGVSSEDLPFEAADFDAVCGQYIVEYTNIQQTIAEVFRVLRPNAVSQFILHHTDSVVVGNARESLRQANLAIKDAKILRLFRRYCDKSSVSALNAEKARQELIDAGTRLEHEASGSENPLFLRYVIDSVSALLQNRQQMSRGEMLRTTDRLERELKNWIRRLNDLASGARSEADLRNIVSMAEALGFDVIDTALQMQDGENLVGWRLNLRKPSSA
jgi:ubiquinone/menaquinone biosynthesis C-methylase UbiE